MGIDVLGSSGITEVTVTMLAKIHSGKYALSIDGAQKVLWGDCLRRGPQEVFQQKRTFLSEEVT